jgi:phage shock protein E
MKTNRLRNFIPLLLAGVTAMAAEEPKNPAIDYAGYEKLTAELQPIRAKHRLSEPEFIKMAAEPGTVILDARSLKNYEILRIKGAKHLALTDFTAESLKKLIPDKTTRILIYCDNNFNGVTHKAVRVAINIPTFIHLHAYGYTNVYELGPLVNLKTSKISIEGESVQR